LGDGLQNLSARGRKGETKKVPPRLERVLQLRLEGAAAYLLQPELGQMLGVELRVQKAKSARAQARDQMRERDF
jgi:hypothetical protein